MVKYTKEHKRESFVITPGNFDSVLDFTNEVQDLKSE
jgi:hypothetical protein